MNRILDKTVKVEREHARFCGILKLKKPERAAQK